MDTLSSKLFQIRFYKEFYYKFYARIDFMDYSPALFYIHQKINIKFYVSGIFCDVFAIQSTYIRRRSKECGLIMCGFIK